MDWIMSLSPFIYWSPNSQHHRMWLYLKIGSLSKRQLRKNEVLGWAMNSICFGSLQEEEIRTCAGETMWKWMEKTPSSSQEERPQKKSTLLSQVYWFFHQEIIREGSKYLISECLLHVIYNIKYENIWLHSNSMVDG